MDPIKINVVISIDEKTEKLLRELLGGLVRLPKFAQESPKEPERASIQPEAPTNVKESLKETPKHDESGLSISELLENPLPKSEPAVPSVDVVVARKAINDARTRGATNEQCKAVLSKYKAAKVGDLSPVDLASFVEEIEHLNA